LPRSAGTRAERADVWPRCASGALRAQRPRRAMDRLADAWIGPAATEVRELGDVGVGGFGLALEEIHRSHDLARLAVAALGHILIEPRLLHGMESLTAGEALDGGHRVARDGAHRRDARTPRGPIDVHRAGATVADTATKPGAGEPRVIAQIPEE